MKLSPWGICQLLCGTEKPAELYKNLTRGERETKIEFVDAKTARSWEVKIQEIKKKKAEKWVWHSTSVFLLKYFLLSRYDAEKSRRNSWKTEQSF